MECPNGDCKSFGFFAGQEEGETFNEISCDSPFECTGCGFVWCTAAQKRARLSVFSLHYWKDFELAELPIFTALYKSFCSESCPNCAVMIVRTGGCKFMTCSKCQYQFCWYCLDEFYTEYHYHFSDCPFRMIVFYSLQALCLVYLVLKMCVISAGFRHSIVTLLYVSYQLGIVGVYVFLWMHAIDRSALEQKTRQL